MTTAAGTAAVYDATAREDFHQDLLRLIARNATLPVSRRRHVGAGARGRNDRRSARGRSSRRFSPRQPPAFACSVPAPLSAQPGEAAAPPRTDAPSTQSAGGQRLQPRESPSAGDVLPEDGRLDARASSRLSG